MPRSTVAANGPIDRPDYRELIGGNIALDFINTIDRTPDILPVRDYLAPGYANLLDWSAFAGIVAEPTVTALRRIARKDGRSAAVIRRRAVDLREALFAIATSLDDELAVFPAALDFLGKELRIAENAQHLIFQDGNVFRVLSDKPDLDAVLWPIAIAAVELFESPLVKRIRRCESPECDAIFLDTSKNRSRRFCSPSGCGNATRVRRFRARLHEVAVPTTGDSG
jgi:predicted RNA-binding Zn ribbon-like protein